MLINSVFQPLPEWEYNGNPESVGYKVQYSRIGPHAKVLTHIILDRLEREFTIEDLEEWTEYEVRVRAINGIGAGPWSQPVRGRTRESGKILNNSFFHYQSLMNISVVYSIYNSIQFGTVFILF